MVDVDEVRKAYDALSATRKVMVDKERGVMLRRVDEAMAPHEREFAVLLHRAHRDGVSKMELRKASRQHGNPHFSRLWNLVGGESTFDMSVDTFDDSVEWVNDTTLVIHTAGQEIVVTEVEWFVEDLDDGDIRKTPTFVIPPEDMRFYQVVYKHVKIALTERDAEKEGEDD